MGNSRPSNTNDEELAFEKLHPEIQRWVYEQNWTELREVQAKTINQVCSSDNDLILAAATAAGKTEAAFLPILSLIAGKRSASFEVIYIGPLKALINDQFSRLESLCGHLEVPVTKWHGDVLASMKRNARERPAGVLLITPESLEALFDRRSELIERMFSGVKFIVVDELHTFLSTERGIQLASLLKRLDGRLKELPRRVGLSATIGDLTIAANWLRPASPQSVSVIEDRSSGADLRLQIRGIAVSANPADVKVKEIGKANSIDTHQKNAGLRQISMHLFKTMRNRGNHLVFASSRRDVELLADMLRELSQIRGVPNQFFPHHGNLSREVRETLELRLKDGRSPTTGIATSTLELGIDIGSVESVAQVDAPRSISALRQRMGRSGRRRGTASVLRIYAREVEVTANTLLVDRLRVDTVQSVAAVRLMLEKWIEPPIALTQNLSTLLHQILAVIVEHGGVRFARLMEIIGGSGPFSNIPIGVIKRLLKGMAVTEPPLLEQAPDGTLMLGPLGEKITETYEFFAVFKTPEEFRIVANGRTLGTVNIENSFGPDDYIVFAGQRWKVIAVDDRARIVQVESAPAGKAPKFGGGEPAPIYDHFLAAIKKVFMESEVPVYLDEVAARQLEAGREEFQRAKLDRMSVVADEGRIYLFPWRGTIILDSLRLALKRVKLVADQTTVSLSVPEEKRAELEVALTEIAQSTNIDGKMLAELDENLERSKYDSLIPRELLREAAAKDRLNAAAIPSVSEGLMADLARL